MMAVFRKALRDSRRMNIWLAIGLVSYALFVMAFYSSIVDQSEELDDLLDSYPDEMIAMFYGGDVADLSITDPGTYVQSQYTLWVVLIMGAIVIGQAFNAITNAERDGTLDVMLSLPVSRRRMLLGRIGNTAVSILVVIIASWVAFGISTVIWPEFDVGVLDLAIGFFGAFFPLMVITGFTYMLATLVPSSRHMAGALAYLFLLGSYLVYVFSLGVEALNDIQPLMLFDYYNSAVAIREGVQWGDWATLSLVALAYFGVAYWAIDRKELGV
jgi:ABC-2 type transport system permease protein